MNIEKKIDKYLSESKAVGIEQTIRSYFLSDVVGDTDSSAKTISREELYSMVTSKMDGVSKDIFLNTLAGMVAKEEMVKLPDSTYTIGK